MRNPEVTRRWAGAALALTLSVGALGACGSSSDKAADSDTGKPTTTAAATATPTAAKAFCDDWVQVDVVANAGPDSPVDGPPSAEAMKTFATSLKTNLDAAVSAAPDELSDSLGKVKTLVDAAASGGDASGLDPSNPALGGPLSSVEEWVHGNCGFAVLDVTGVDYAFQDLPKTIKSGVVSIKFHNMATDEEHEMGIARIKPGAAITAADLLKAIESDPMGTEQKYADQIEFVGAVDAQAGKTSYATMTLEPGEYLAACFIPVGGKEGGELHAQKGMAATLTVS